MAVSLIFADGFGHYDTDTGLKWSTSGGIFETTPAHVRTGPQSLLIQSGNSPSITNFNFPVDTGVLTIGQFGKFVVGFAWQTTVLGGETIVELWAYRDSDGTAPLSPHRRLFQLLQNADGSITITTGNGLSPTVIGTTAAGVLTIGPFWYIELSVDMIGATLALTITDAANTATVVLAASGFSTFTAYIDALVWGGPSGLNSAWVSDFYFGQWDGSAPAVLGAPKIYGVVPPISPDGFGRVNNLADPAPFNVTSPPFFPQVDTIPQDTATFIAREDVDGFFAFTLGQGFVYDVSAIPGGSTIVALQAVHMWSKGHDIDGNAPASCVFMAFSGDAGSFSFNGVKASPLPNSPFLFSTFAFDQNPLTAADWALSDFSGPSAQQIGPGVLSLG